MNELSTKKVASLDIGSNSFLLLLTEANGHGFVKILSDQIDIVRLGQGIGHSGKFHPDALARAEKKLSEYSDKIKKFVPDVLIAKATAAARKATNSDELIKIGNKFDIPIQIISGEQEAETTYLGLIWGNGYKEKSFPILVIDVGGGSTELIVGNQKGIIKKLSWSQGAVSLFEKFQNLDVFNKISWGEIERYIKNEIEGILDSQFQNISNIVAVAGTPTTLAQIDFNGIFNEEKINGHVLTKRSIDEKIDQMIQLSIEERINQLKIPQGRADILPFGATVLKIILNLLNKDQLTVSTRGIRHGHVARYFSEGKR